MSLAANILDLITGVAAIIAKRIGERRYEWAQYATEHPARAAFLLRSAATELEARADAKRPKAQNRWHARYLRERAEALREQAEDVLRFARHEQCRGNPVAMPGKWRPAT